MVSDHSVYLKLSKQLETDNFMVCLAIIPSCHLLNVRGRPTISHSHHLASQTSNEIDRLVNRRKSRNRNGSGLIDGLPIIDLGTQRLRQIKQ